MSNIYARFRQLIPETPLQIGIVTAHNSDGTSTVELYSGGITRVRGQDVAVGYKAFVQDGEIKGTAPSLPTYSVDV